MSKLALVILLVMTSCNASDCTWRGGEITDFGTYCNAQFRVHVFEEGNDLKYEVSNDKNEVLIRQDMSISVIHYWGLFLDEKGNFWVFSSDVGTAIWEKDSTNGKYRKRVFNRELSREDVPNEIYMSSLRRFLN